MNQCNISIFTSYLRIFIVLLMLIICLNNGHVVANDESIDSKNFLPENIELDRRGVWSRLFRNEANLPQKMNRYSYDRPNESGYASKNRRVQFIPHGKRTIPLELRKALYAHGIVGRRR